eukprot:3808557-Pleurochrysis_carterae.AAC.1
MRAFIAQMRAVPQHAAASATMTPAATLPSAANAPANETADRMSELERRNEALQRELQEHRRRRTSKEMLPTSAVDAPSCQSTNSFP